MAKKQNTTLPILAHLLGLFTGFIGPLIILLVSEDETSKKHSKLALNWQFSVLVYALVSFILIFILIGFLTILAVGVLNVVFSIMATVKASENKMWEYPLAIKFFKIKV